MRLYQRDVNRPSLNVSDLVALLLALAVFSLLAISAQHMAAPYAVGQNLKITLNPSELPYYALRSVTRMFAALGLSFLFTFTMGTLAAKYRTMERFILPFIDIMQSVPVLGFLSITVVGFIQLFPGSLLGPECASIFAVFTSQAWNMALSFYQSLKTVPRDLMDCARVFQLNAWQRFWRIEVPFAMPNLTWNAMISMSAGWFFVVASEAISVNNQTIHLPGIGSYIAYAIEAADLTAIVYAIFTMFVVILLYDQLLFRPILSFSTRFSHGVENDDDDKDSWLLNVLQRTTWLRFFNQHFRRLSRICIFKTNARPLLLQHTIVQKFSGIAPWIWYSALTVGLMTSAYCIGHFIFTTLSLAEVKHVFMLGAITTFKITILILLSSLLWVPVGVWIGLRPKWTKWCQPLTQFIAAFPANLVYPLVVMCIVKYHLNVEIWTAPLMILGTQWYILSNVIAGASSIPREFLLVAKNLGVRRWLWWRKISLPAIFPHYITGAMAAAGGAWNASIIADMVQWGDTRLTATGLGGYIAQATYTGDFPRIALSLSVMCLYVIMINRTVWQNLYERTHHLTKC